MIRWSVTIVLAIGIAVGFIVLRNQRSPMEGSVAEASSRPSSQAPTVFADGIVEGRYRITELRFEIGGRLQAIDVREGESVEQGEVLARLVSTSWQIELEKAKQTLAIAVGERDRLKNGARQETRKHAKAREKAAEARAQKAEKRYRRSFELLRRSVLSQQEFDDIAGAYLAAQAELEAAQNHFAEVVAPAREDELRMADAKIALETARVSEAEDALSKTLLRAPRSGIVLRVSAEKGELIGPNQPKAIITFVDCEEQRVRAYVEELEAFRVEVGQSVEIKLDALPGERFLGEVIFCAPVMAPKTTVRNHPGERLDVRVREVLIRLEQSDQLIYGMPVDVYINPTGQTAKTGRPTAPSPLGDPDHSF